MSRLERFDRLLNFFSEVVSTRSFILIGVSVLPWLVDFFSSCLINKMTSHPDSPALDIRRSHFPPLGGSVTAPPCARPPVLVTRKITGEYVTFVHPEARCALMSRLRVNLSYYLFGSHTEHIDHSSRPAEQLASAEQEAERRAAASSSSSSQLFGDKLPRR